MNSAATNTTKRLLVVDDSQTIRRAVEMVFVATEFQVTGAATVSEALVHFNGASFDLVLVDANLNGANGLELARTLKQGAADCPILMMVAESETDPQFLEAAEIDGHLIKPFRSQGLIDQARMLTGSLVIQDSPKSFEEQRELERLEQEARRQRMGSGVDLGLRGRLAADPDLDLDLLFGDPDAPRAADATETEANEQPATETEAASAVEVSSEPPEAAPEPEAEVSVGEAEVSQAEFAATESEAVHVEDEATEVAPRQPAVVEDSGDDVVQIRPSPWPKVALALLAAGALAAAYFFTR